MVWSCTCSPSCPQPAFLLHLPLLLCSSIISLVPMSFKSYKMGITVLGETLLCFQVCSSTGGMKWSRFHPLWTWWRSPQPGLAWKGLYSVTCCSGPSLFYTRSHSRFFFPAPPPVRGGPVSQGCHLCAPSFSKAQSWRKEVNYPRRRLPGLKVDTSGFLGTESCHRRIQLKNILRGSCNPKYHRRVRTLTVTTTKCMCWNVWKAQKKQVSPYGMQGPLESQGPHQTQTSPDTCSWAHCCPCSDLHILLMPVSL